MARLHGKGCFLASASLLLSLIAATVQAAGLQVTPTMIKVPAGRAADGLTLANSNSSPLHAQARVFAWTQRNGEDVLEPTRDVAISPPMIELPGNSRQLVRVVRLVPPPQDGVETSYRVIVDELPVTTDEGQTGLQFVLKYSIPVFLVPAGDGVVAPELHARLVNDGGVKALEVSNTGNGHAQIADLAFVNNDGTRVEIAPGLSGYVLPGNERRWRLPGDWLPSQVGTFTARVNGESEVRTLAVQDPAR